MGSIGVRSRKGLTEKRNGAVRTRAVSTEVAVQVVRKYFVFNIIGYDEKGVVKASIVCLARVDTWWAIFVGCLNQREGSAPAAEAIR